jgi:hypothetical protein
MSTKVPENCPKCANETFPTDKCMVYGNVPVRTWRYECACGWTWANDMQREHNGREYSKMHKVINAPMYS